MRRRRYLARFAGVTGTAVAGCLEGFGGEGDEDGGSVYTPVLEDRPDEIYLPTHVEGMRMIGTVDVGDRRVGLSYTYPHRFWTVTGRRRDRVQVREQDSVHLMLSIWEPTTETVLPISGGLSLEVRRDGEPLTERTPWPMLSQPMGFHFGDNVALSGPGTYEVIISVGAMTTDRYGPFEGRFETVETASVEFGYSEVERNEIAPTWLENPGERGAAPPMGMEMLPSSTAPEPAALPGRLLGEATSGDAVFVLAATDEVPAVGDGTYLAVSARTPYNGYVLPMMSLSVAVDRDGETVHEGPLSAAIDPDRRYHYGGVMDELTQGDELSLEVDAPPQVSRHDGYETAFLEMPPMSIVVE